MHLWTKGDSSGMSAGLHRTPANHITRKKKGRRAVWNIWERTNIPETQPGDVRETEGEKKFNREAQISISFTVSLVCPCGVICLCYWSQQSKVHLPAMWIIHPGVWLASRQRSAHAQTRPLCATAPARNLAHEFHLMRKKIRVEKACVF